MVRFAFLPPQDEDGGMHDPKTGKPRQGTFKLKGQVLGQEDSQDFMGPRTEFQAESERPKGPGVFADSPSYSQDKGPVEQRAKVQKAHADIEDAYGAATKALTRPTLGATPTNEGYATFTGAPEWKDTDDIDATLERVKNRENPLKLADDIRHIAARPSIPPKYREMLFGAAEKLTNAAKKQSDVELLKKPGGPLHTSPEDAAARYRSTVEQIQKKQEDLKSAGNFRGPDIQKQIRQLETEKARLERMNASGEMKIPGVLNQMTNQAEQPEAGKPLGPPPIHADIDAAIRANGYSRKEVMEEMNESMQELAAYIKQKGGEFDPHARVRFTQGLLTAAEAMGKEAMTAIGKWAMDEVAEDRKAKEYLLHGSNGSGTATNVMGPPTPYQTMDDNPAAGTVGPSTPQQATGEQPGTTGLTPTQMSLQQNYEERKRARKELAEAEELQSWPAIVAFVILAMVLQNGRAAFALFSNARQKRFLQGWLEELHVERRQLWEQHKMEQEEAGRSRREAAERSVKADERKDDKAHDFALLMARSKARIEEAKKRTSSLEEKDTLNNMRRDLDMYQGRVAEIQKQLEAMADPFKKDIYGHAADEKGQQEKSGLRSKLVANLNFYTARAEKMADIIEQITGSADLIDEASRLQGVQSPKR